MFYLQQVSEQRDRIIATLRQNRRELPWQAFRLMANACGIPVTKSDRRLKSLRDIHKGQRGFIIGNGPSLRIGDLDRLKGEITFASNKVYLAFDETEWRPTYYSVLDFLIAKNSYPVIQALDVEKIFVSIVRPFFSDNEEITYLRDLPNPFFRGQHQFRFSKNLLLGVYGGCTVLYMQMQLALFMGIKNIYLIGVDFSFTIPKPTGERNERGELVLKHVGEINHFHPDYRKPGEEWTMPRLDYQSKAFLCAKNVFEAEGGFIANASRKTALDVFPTVSFDDIVPSH